MQCIWTSTSNVLRRPAWRASPAATKLTQPGQHRNFSWSQIIGHQTPDVGSKRAKLSSLAQAFVSTAIRDTSIPPSPLPIAEAPSDGEALNKDEISNHTAARLSRTAAQSVRLACQGPSTRDGFLIVKSLQTSVRHYDKRWHPGKRFPPKVAIDFGMAVSPRLAIHSLLHALVRRGLTKKAGDVARQILFHEPELRLHDRTLRLVTSALCQTDIHALRDEDFRSQVQRAKSQFVDYLVRPSFTKQVSGNKVQLPCTRVALQLFFAAKQYRKQRAKQMFQQLIDACLLQGEILVVSFLFAFLVKQWQARLSKASATDTSEPSWVDRNVVNLPPSGALNPKEAFLSQTLAFINSVIFNRIPPDPHAVKPSHEEAVQALAVLAGMLHEGLLLHSQIAVLVSTLISFPSSASVLVWTMRKGKKEKWERRDAREYFDEVLDDLVARVTHTSYGRYGNGQYWAGVRTFNSLLHYSLRRKLSPALGESIVKRMQTIGGNVAPNITTFNIVLRSSTLFRRHDMSGKVLEMLRERPENEGHSITYAPYEQHEQEGIQEGTQKELLVPDPVTNEPRQCGEITIPTKPFDTFCPPSSSRFVPDNILARLPRVIQRILFEEFDPDNLTTPDSTLLADGSTLAAYIDYLTTSGHPEIVAKLVKILIPELKVATYPSGSVEARRLGRRRRRFSRPSAVSRALGLGPLFFTSVLNALVKSGKTGLAERVWRLAKVAERSSWNPEYKTVPWVLPRAAYTVMMQCYAAEARKGLRTLHAPSLTAVQKTDRTRRIMGWGSFVVARRLAFKQSLSPYETSRDTGAHLFRTMLLSANSFRAQLTAYLEQGGNIPDPKTIELPTPDERFFNAALDLFGRLPWSRISTTKKLSPYRWRRLDRRQLIYFIERGSVRIPRDPRLVSVILAMHKAGYEVPAGYRHMLVGIHVPPPSEDRSHPRRGTSRNPHRASVLTPLHLPTSKDRGLPVANNLKVGKKRTYSIISSL